MKDKLYKDWSLERFEDKKQDSIEIKFDHGNFIKTGNKQFDMLVVSKDKKDILKNNVLEMKNK